MYSVKLPPSACVMKPDWPGLELDLDAGRHHDRLDVAAQDEGFVVVRSHGYSVFTGSALRSSAAFSVCQQRLAHFTRTGNSRTPDKRGEFAEVLGHGRVVLREHLVDLVEQVRDLGALSCP